MKVFSPFLNGNTTTSGSFNVPNHPGTGSIPNPLTGSLFHDDTDGILKIYTGTQWTVVGEQAVPVYNPNATFSDLSLTGSQSTGTDVASITITDEDNQTPYSASLSGPDASNFTFEWSNADSSSGFIETATSLSAGTYSYFVTVFDSDLNSSVYARTTTFATAAPYNIEYLVVAGGGGGGGVGGAGGAGGYLTNTITSVADTAYTITVGGGGAPSATNNPWNGDGAVGANGSNSVFSTITSLGGGGGAGAGNAALSGGSGGGSRSGTVGSGTNGQGNSGAQAGSYIGGGGGGAGQAGNSSMKGGDGLQSSITGTPTYYAGGGGGGGNTSGGGYGVGGLGGGASAGGSAAGTVNTGGGGCGGTWTNNSNTTTQRGGAGGSGVVILRMLTSNYTGITTGSPTITTDGSDTILTFTQSGTYTA